MRKEKSIVAICTFAIWAVSCTPQASFPAVTSTPVTPSATLYRYVNPITPSKTRTPTATFGPLPTYTTSPLPLPDLHTAGPYLAPIVRAGKYILGIFYDLDGSGRRELSPPDTAEGDPYDGSFSPDGRWYAYVTGSKQTKSWNEWSDRLPPGGIQLHVANLWTGETRDVIALLPPDFYRRQEIMTRQFSDLLLSHNMDPEEDYRVNITNAINTLYTRVLEWSPDGRYLAFAAMIDGNSTDVYLYDLDTRHIRRKDSDPWNVMEIDWSQDGRWIIHQSQCPGMVIPVWINSWGWDPTPVHAVQAVGSNAGASFPYLYPFGEASDSEWLMTRNYSQAYPGGVDLILVDTGDFSQTTIWKGDWQWYALDAKNRTILLTVEDPASQTKYDYDLYYGPLQGPLKKIGDDDYGQLVYRGGRVHTFLAVKDSDLRWISPDGAVETFSSGMDWPDTAASPDYRYFAVFGKGGFMLFDESDEVIFDWRSVNVYGAAWRTNSQGLYLLTGGWIYYFEPGWQMPKKIINCDVRECSEFRSLAILPGVNLSTLPSLRVQPPSIEKQTQGASLWTQADFQDLTQPGRQEYSVTLPAYSSWRWDFSWCAETQDGLAAILAPFQIEFYIGGEKLGEDIFRFYDTNKDGGICRTWATLLSGWQPGDATDLEIHYTLSEGIYDGTRGYPAGEYRQIVHVTVS